MVFSSKRILRNAVILLLIFYPSFLIASEITVKGIRYWSSSDYTRVVVDLSEPVEFSKNCISNPDRLYLDLLHSKITQEIKTNLPIGDGILKAVRAGQFNDDTVRVVLDLQGIDYFNTFTLDNPARLVIDAYSKKKIKITKPDTVIIERKIVIDPGHGGHDPGAIGPSGLYEKDIVLDIAKKLKKILSINPLNKVFLTRKTDTFIPLEERTAIANKKNADLFVSIHANASPRRRARGIETYLLNWTNNEEAMKVAARENAISLKKMKDLSSQMGVLNIIKSDLMRANKRDESIKLAHYIQKSMISTLNNESKNIVDLGIKQALFYVLFGAQMPSVLIEVSFISNPEEERLLSKESYRTQIAEAVAEGINKYFVYLPAVKNL